MFIVSIGLSSWTRAVYFFHILELSIGSRAPSLRPWVIYFNYDTKQFILSRDIRSWLGVFWVNKGLGHFIVFRGLSSWASVIHIIHDPKLFKILSSRLGVVHVNHSFELVIVFRALSLWAMVIHVNHNDYYSKSAIL